MNAQDIIDTYESHDLFNKHILDNHQVCTVCHMATKDGQVNDEELNSTWYKWYMKEVYGRDPKLFIEIILALLLKKSGTHITTLIDHAIVDAKKEPLLAKIEAEVLKQGGEQAYDYVANVGAYDIAKFKEKIVKECSPRTCYHYVLYVQLKPCLETLERVKEDPSMEAFYIDCCEKRYPKETAKVCKAWAKKHWKGRKK